MSGLRKTHLERLRAGMDKTLREEARNCTPLAEPTKDERLLAQRLRERGLPLLAQQADALIDQLCETREALRDGLTVFADTEWARTYAHLWGATDDAS